MLGVDLSEDMIALARRRAPEAEFRVGSLFEAGLPPCKAVTSIGECLNYTPDPESSERSLYRIFRRVRDALSPGGVFVFDLAEPGQVRPGEPVRGFSEGEVWTVPVEKREDPERETQTRRIVAFREAGEGYRHERGDVPAATVPLRRDCGQASPERVPGPDAARLRPVSTSEGRVGLRGAQTSMS